MILLFAQRDIKEGGMLTRVHSSLSSTQKTKVHIHTYTHTYTYITYTHTYTYITYTHTYRTTMCHNEFMPFDLQ